MLLPRLEEVITGKGIYLFIYLFSCVNDVPAFQSAFILNCFDDGRVCKNYHDEIWGLEEVTFIFLGSGAAKNIYLDRRQVIYYV